MTDRTAHPPHARPDRSRPARAARGALQRVLDRVRQQDAALRGLCDDAHLTPVELDDAIRALDAVTPGFVRGTGDVGPHPGGRR